MLNEKQLNEIIADTAALTGIGSEPEFALKYLELLRTVDDDGNYLGSAPRGLVHRLGLRHEVVYAAIYSVSNPDQMLLQVRGSGRFDIAVGGHMQASDSSPLAAIVREFQEEIGYAPQNDELALISVYNRDAPISSKRPLERNRERRYVFSLHMKDDAVSSLGRLFEHRQEKLEVVRFEWCTVETIEEYLSKGVVADGLASTWPYLRGA